MTIHELTGLATFIILAGTSILLMLLITFFRSQGMPYIICLIGLSGAFFSLTNLPIKATEKISGLIILDGYSKFFLGLIFLTGIVLTVISSIYFRKRENSKEEYYILLILAIIGSSVLVTANHFVTLFLGLEILSVSLYSLISFTNEKEKSVEAGTKYLVLAAVSSSFLLFGLALLYADTGLMNLTEMGKLISLQKQLHPLQFTGFAFTITGIAFKLGLVPFHLWIPEVYEGGPAPVTAFIASISKGAVFSFILRIFVLGEGYRNEQLLFLFSLLAVLSMLIGNLLALRQKNIKRILAYSSISQFGYLLVAFLGGGVLGLKSAMFYLFAYMISITSAFSVISLFSTGKNETMDLDEYRGMFWQRPGLAFALTISILSLAGMPLTAGFFGKYFVIASGMKGWIWVPLGTLIITSVIGLFYYLRIISVLFQLNPRNFEKEKAPLFFFKTETIILGFLSISLIVIGIFPEILLEVIKNLLKNSGV